MNKLPKLTKGQELTCNGQPLTQMLGNTNADKTTCQVDVGGKDIGITAAYFLLDNGDGTFTYIGDEPYTGTITLTTGKHNASR